MNVKFGENCGVTVDIVGKQELHVEFYYFPKIKSYQ
jgi:hypothetical protein